MAAAQGRGVCSGSHFVPQLHLEAKRRRKQSESTVDLKTQSVKLRTMESARSAFHAQLATVMDSLLAAAVCEIAKIFESSLCEQQAELVQKTEEIHLLRDKLERRQKTKSGGSEDGKVPPGERDGSLILTGSVVNVGNYVSSHQDPIEGLSQSLSGLKEEVTGHDGASVKHERAGSQPTLGSVSVQAEEGALAAGDQRQIDTLSVTQAKAKMSHWVQDPHSADHRPLQDQASTPFLSISQSGCCSPRSDPGLTQPGEWFPRLDATRGLENLQADGTSCSVPASSSAGTEAPCFRPGFGPDEASNQSGDGSFPFLDQEHENQNSNQNSGQGRGMGQTEAREDQPQAPSGESPWRPRDDRGGRINISLTRRVTSLGVRDPLRPQSNSQSLTLRHTNALSHPPVPGGGNVRPYTCPYCTKCFTYPSHQRRHLLRHTGVRLHPCQFCDKSFLTPSELTVHTRTHTGERPFGCAQCGKRFARSGNLRAHQRDVHMGKRPFACTECGKRFAHRGNLRVHNHRVHQGDPYYMEDQQEPDLVPNPM
ncbi:zinc finger protein 768-like [Solea solea]|uniref:zinc finger protein 768-like n=1 Tax=Solea solea TaxID=90069 RepID=UPI00272B5990|nr:zinc finger protein 768-like [Solea solea]XP_058506302.1 zinc finger protein 768-like [Solea solea]